MGSSGNGNGSVWAGWLRWLDNHSPFIQCAIIIAKFLGTVRKFIMSNYEVVKGRDSGRRKTNGGKSGRPRATYVNYSPSAEERAKIAELAASGDDALRVLQEWVERGWTYSFMWDEYNDCVRATLHERDVKYEDRVYLCTFHIDVAMAAVVMSFALSTRYKDPDTWLSQYRQAEFDW